MLVGGIVCDLAKTLIWFGLVYMFIRSVTHVTLDTSVASVMKFC